ncbi:MAG TPA: crosslink repair DNA glycosylase YcaQ family protein [Candidatus Acidoferrum sp.]|nr:crosslink repair DNA glycosylase YcaQ family protein [Candidatus Acidoferrum sp.]
MTDPREISAATARRYLAIHHFLAPPRSLPGGEAGILAVLDRLGSLQFDPIDVAGRNHDLVLLARVADYRRQDVDRLLYETRALYETYNKGLSIVPTAELPWYRVTWDRARRRHDGGTFDEHAPLVEELLTRIRENGPMSATDVEPRAAIDWYWRPTNQVRAILEALAEAGILGLARRDGNRRVYDLAERLFPVELLDKRVPVRESFRHRLLSRYRAHGLLGSAGSAELWMGTMPIDAVGHEGGLPLKSAARKVLQAELVESGDLLPVTVEGIRGMRFVAAEDVPRLDQAERELTSGEPPGGCPPGVAFLAPLDPLVWDREMLRTLYGFDYIWEVYVPGPRRRWGYYVLPILFGDRLVGRINPRADRKAGVLEIVDVWWEDGVDAMGVEGLVDALAVALEAYRRFTGMRQVALPTARGHRDLVRRLRQRLPTRTGAASARTT